MEAMPGLPSLTQEQMKEDKRPVLIHVTVWLHVLASLCLVLRLASRRVKNLKLGVDDWLIIAAQVVGYGHAADVITMAVNGSGQHIMAVLMRPDAAHAIQVQAKGTYAISPLNTTQLTLTKASVLALYLRVFPQRYIRLGVYMLGAILGAWWVTFVCLNLFGCDPISRGWSLDAATCISRGHAVNTIGTICDTVINVLILALPVHAIVQLRVRAWQKFAIAGLFLLGGLSTASAWIRWWAAEGFRNQPEADAMYNTYKVLIFLVLEMATGVMGVSLSTVTPILSYFTLRMGFKRASMALNKADVAGLVTIGGSDGSLERPASRPASRPRLFGQRQGETDNADDERPSFSGPASGTR
ncbi:hypothetical protein PGQ11_014007 [Apiospora arundinis]|uniref:Rhodopsin domain-containing protein n=1 Tax=Apiospora arundinis TaxID=335852 RepID=A0ABR2HRG0_9PEZI